MRHRHVLAQASHQRHLIGVYRMDDTASTEEQTSLEHGMGEQMEHRSHVTQLSVVVVMHAVMSRQTHTQCHHHERDLRDGREGEHALDIALGTGHSSCIESGEHTYPHHDTQRLRSKMDPQGEHTCNLEHTSHHHRSGMDKG